MKTTGKILCLLMALLLSFAFASCAQNADNSATVPGGGQNTAGTGGNAGTGENGGAVAGTKVLVVWYSATGSTGKIAGVIASALGADTFELTPETPYSSADLNWNDADSRVSREHRDTSLRQVPLTATTVGNFEEYDTVFLGYPIWWGEAAWVVNGFVAANDFTGKTVIPFCTSASSGMGESATALAAMAGSGNWQSGRRFSGSAGASAVNDWLRELGFRL